MGRVGRVLPEVMVHYHCHHYHGQLGFRSSKPLRSAPLDIEVAVVSIFVLVFPDNDVRSDNIGQPRAGDDIFFFVLAKCSLHFIGYRMMGSTVVGHL